LGLCNERKGDSGQKSRGADEMAVHKNSCFSG
jgi:hypothetical protein